MAKVQRASAAGQPCTWIDLRRAGPSSDDLENRRTLLGLVNKLTFTNMDTICSQMVSCMHDPYLLGEAVEMVFNQALNPAWMVLFANFCSRLAKDSPYFGRHGEINFMSLLLAKYRTEFERAVYINVPSLVQLCAKCVSTSTSLPSSLSPSGGAALSRDEVDALLPQELVSYLREQPWVVTPKAREQRWRRMNELIVLLGELYNVRLVEEEQVHRMLAQLCDSIEKGMHRNVEPLCKLLFTVGPVLAGRSAKRREHLNVDQDMDMEAIVSDDDSDDGDEEAEGGRDAGGRGSNFVRATRLRGRTKSEGRRTGKEEGLDGYMAKAESYLQRVKEWKLGERIRFMIQDLLELKARNWQRR